MTATISQKVVLLAACQSRDRDVLRPERRRGACQDSSDCCDVNAICNLSFTFCVQTFGVCSVESDWCSGFCAGGLCEGVISQ